MCLRYVFDIVSHELWKQVTVHTKLLIPSISCKEQFIPLFIYNAEMGLVNKSYVFGLVTRARIYNASLKLGKTLKY